MLLTKEPAWVTEARTDPAAFATIYDQYFSRVYNYVRYRISSPARADDITAQIFERALANLKRYDSKRAPFEAWLFAIARNAVNDALRQQQRRKLLSLDVVENRPSSDPTPEQALMKKELRHKVLQAVGKLDERERDLIALKFASGLTNRRIAELTGLTKSNVGVILYRAMKRLRVELED